MKDADAYNSELKLHNAGYLAQGTGLLGDTRGKSGSYWSSNQYSTTGFGAAFIMTNTASSVQIGNYASTYKANGMPLRCLKN